MHWGGRTYRSMTWSVAEFVDPPKFMGRLARSEAKSLCLLTLPEPDNESAECAGKLTVWPAKAGVPGIDDAGVNSPPLSLPLWLPTSKLLTKSSTSFLEVVDAVVTYPTPMEINIYHSVCSNEVQSSYVWSSFLSICSLSIGSGFTEFCKFRPFRLDLLSAPIWHNKKTRAK